MLKMTQQANLAQGALHGVDVLEQVANLLHSDLLILRTMTR